MKFTLENTRNVHIHGYQPGKLTLRLPNKNTAESHQLVHYHSSLIISNAENVEDWAVTQTGELEAHHFDVAWQNKPEIVLFGSGQQLVFPSPEIRHAFASKGIGFEAMNTPAACRTYNVLLSEGRDVMAMLIID